MLPSEASQARPPSSALLSTLNFQVPTEHPTELSSLNEYLAQISKVLPQFSLKHDQVCEKQQPTMLIAGLGVSIAVMKQDHQAREGSTHYGLGPSP